MWQVCSETPCQWRLGTGEQHILPWWHVLQRPRSKGNGLSVRSQQRPQLICACRLHPPPVSGLQHSSLASRSEGTQPRIIQIRAAKETASPARYASSTIDGLHSAPRHVHDRDRKHVAEQPESPGGQHQQHEQHQKQAMLHTLHSDGKHRAGPSQREILDRILLGGPLGRMEPLLAAAAPSRLNFSLHVLARKRRLREACDLFDWMVHRNVASEHTFLAFLKVCIL